MSEIPFINRRNITDSCISNYAVAAQWLSTYRVSNNPRHLDTAYTCYAIADDLYGQSFDKYLDRDETLMQRIRSESRKRVTESFAALASMSYARVIESI